jgi:SM-20-related protein
MVSVRILLSGGHHYQFTCSTDDPAISALSQAMSQLASDHNAKGLLRIEAREGNRRRALEVPVSAVIGVETDPPLPLGNVASNGIVERARYVRIPDFLSADENERVLEFAFERESEFKKAAVSTGKEGYRSSRVLHSLDGLDIDLEGRIREIAPEVLCHLALGVPAESSLEAQVTVHTTGGYYRVHNDNGSPETANRLLTYVYYFHREPAGFTGGELRLYDLKYSDGFIVAADTYFDLAPSNNMIIFFPSSVLHEVRPIDCPSGAFADGRFTVNGWLRDLTVAVGNQS